MTLRHAAGLLATALSASLAFAGDGTRSVFHEVPVTNSYPLATLPISTSGRLQTLNTAVPIPQFNPSATQGVLCEVRIQLITAEGIQFRGSLNVPPPSCQPLQLNVQATHALLAPGVSPPTTQLPFVWQPCIPLSSFRSFLTNLGTRTVGSAVMSVTSSLGSYQGTGTLPITLRLQYLQTAIAPGNSGSGAFTMLNTTRVRVTYLYDPRATVQSYGVPCLGSNGAPILNPVGAPRIPSPNYQLQLLSGAPSSLAAPLLSGAVASIPLGAGCNLLVQPPFLVPYSFPLDASGNGFAPLPIPYDPFFHGVFFYVQCVVIDPGAPLGLTLTRGLQLILGA